MANIQKIDSNLKVHTGIKRENTAVYDVCSEPFRIFGLQKPQTADDCFLRIPTETARQVSEGVLYLHTNTAGGRVKFATDSQYIAICAELKNIAKMPHMPLTGSAGFDLYRRYGEEECYVHTFTPPWDVESSYASEWIAPYKTGICEYTLNFPLYSDVSRLRIILDQDAQLKECCEYRINRPVVFYGSSITQGGCASRPGNAYQSIISRRLNMDYLNLGFSGNAKGEQSMARYIAGLSMSAFVMDYDHNAPTAEYLRSTHENFFHTVRSAHPNLPIICVSKPVCKTEEERERRRIIQQTVENAREAGDDNVYFVDGGYFSEELDAGDGITVDGCHPNDLGFRCMANVIGNVLSQIFRNKSEQA